MERVNIVTDSAACLPQEIKDDYHIEVVPLNIHNKDKVYQDGIDITPQQVYSWQRADSPLTTSAPSPGVFVESFQRLSVKTKEILCLTVASTYSATFTSMQSAIEIAKKQLPKIRIELVDCYTGSAAQALVVLTAARATGVGKNLNEVISKAQQVIPKAEINLVLDTLKYLERGGRAPKAGAWATSLLKIKPVVTNRMGHAHFMAIVRSRTQGVERIVRAIGKKVGLKKLTAIVVHSDLKVEAQELKQRLVNEFNCHEIYVTEVSSVVATHIGPGAIGIAFCPEE